MTAPPAAPPGKLNADFARIAAVRAMMQKTDIRTSENFGRAETAAWISRFSGPVAPDVSIKHVAMPFEYHDLQPLGDNGDVVIYIHGGGLVYYDSSVFLPTLSQCAARSGKRIFALDYPKAPEAPAPDICAAIADTISNILSTIDAPHITIAGDSVGGLLALQMALCSHVDVFSAVTLIYPVVAAPLSYNGPYATKHFLDAEMMAWFRDFIDPLFSVLGAPPLELSHNILRKLPPTSIHLAECDILCEEGTAFAQQCEAAGVLTQCTVHKSLPHDFYLYGASIPAAQEAIDSIAL